MLDGITTSANGAKGFTSIGFGSADISATELGRPAADEATRYRLPLAEIRIG